jgi:transcriptional regulator with XRE-family HTH domain
MNKRQPITLPDRRQQVIDALEGGAYTYQQIADEMGVTRQRVDQIMRTRMGSMTVWALRKLAENKKSAAGITAFGETKPRSAWAADPRCPVTTQTISQRIRKGWPPEEAIATPIGARPPRWVEITAQERAELLDLLARAEGVRFNYPPNHPARQAAHERDRLVREMVNRGVRGRQIAEAAGVKVGTVHQWLSFTSRGARYGRSRR